jgi:hypothetical protein
MTELTARPVMVTAAAVCASRSNATLLPIQPRRPKIKTWFDIILTSVDRFPQLLGRDG